MTTNQAFDMGVGKEPVTSSSLSFSLKKERSLSTVIYKDLLQHRSSSGLESRKRGREQSSWRTGRTWLPSTCNPSKDVYEVAFLASKHKQNATKHPLPVHLPGTQAGEQG